MDRDEVRTDADSQNPPASGGPAATGVGRQPGLVRYEGVLLIILKWMNKNEPIIWLAGMRSKDVVPFILQRV